MARITSIEELMFPVTLMPLFTERIVHNQTQRIKVPNNRLVMNKETGVPLGVVSKDYRLVSNQEAIELGRQCCLQLFDISETQHIKVFNVDAPSTASYCHIDLVHKNFVMNLWDGPGEPENYVPYIRITNSYNRTRSLRFDIGFCRKICLNGVIFEAETIDFTYNHSRGDIGSINFSIKKNKLDDLARKFKDYIATIKAFTINEEDSFEILKALLRIKASKKLKSDYEVLVGDIQTRHASYRNELGGNAYALFNTMTDIASKPPSSRCFRRDQNSLQKIAGVWIKDFGSQIKKPDFVMNKYLLFLRGESLN